MTTLRKCKDSSPNGRRYLQIIFLIRGLYLEYIRSSYSSIIRQIIQLKGARDLNRHFSEKDIQVVNKLMKKILDMIIHQRNSNQNHNDIPFHTHQDGENFLKYVGKDEKKPELSHSAVGNVKCCHCFGKQSSSFSNS